MKATNTDSIEKTVRIGVPRQRVWRALTDSKQFGAWFGAKMEGPFELGARVRGAITIPGYEHVTMDITIERIEPERVFAWRWHPYAVEPGVDYSTETPTLVTFELEEVDGGTQLTVVESGFDRIPLARRAMAFRMNSEGWASQLERIERYVSKSS